MNRREEYRRISAMAGYDENGCILPPPAGGGINRSASPYWKTRNYNLAGCTEASEMTPDTGSIPTTG